MKRFRGVLFSFLLLFSAIWLLDRCRKEEIVIVYSKISTVKASNTTYCASDIEGNIEELTEATHTEFGVAFDTVAEPTVYKNKVLAAGTVKTGSFTVNISGLKPSKTYHVRAFVIDNKKYIYGSDLTFITADAKLPVVTTTSVSGITSKYAYSGGNVTSQGDKTVIAKGVCYDTVASPTILKSKTMDGWGTGSFTSYLSGLMSARKYYLRAYATSELGTSYGSEVSFTTNDAIFSFHEEFADTTNHWTTGTVSNGSADITGGEYVISFNGTGTWQLYKDFPAFLQTANSRDYEITASMSLGPYSTGAFLYTAAAGLAWDCNGPSYNYFVVQKSVERDLTIFPPTITTTIEYIIGKCTNGSYTIWKTATLTSLNTYNVFSVKKGEGYYYFYLNDVMLYKKSYSNISNGGIGVTIDGARINVDYIYIDQRGDKKSDKVDHIGIDPLSPGKQFVSASGGYK